MRGRFLPLHIHRMDMSHPIHIMMAPFEFPPSTKIHKFVCNGIGSKLVEVGEVEITDLERIVRFV